MCTDTQNSGSSLGSSPYWAFAVFGAFWGSWGASIPRLRELAGVSDGELGVALLFVGLGALPSMLLTGPALDRWGLWLTGPLLLALGLAGAGVSLTAGGGMTVLCAGMALVGATSGAADVAINSFAGRSEQMTGRPVITRSHATFSGVVVAAILLTGALAAMRAPLVAPFALTSIAAVTACVVIALAFRRRPPDSAPLASPLESDHPPNPELPLSLIFGLGALGALAFAAENAHQSWSALFLEVELSAPVGVSAFGPAVFAGIVAISRFSIARVPSNQAGTLLLAGALAATTGAVSLAFAPTLGWALAALAIAAAGTAVLFPTILGMVSRSVSEHRRARATSLVTTIAYLGFLAGPAYVGLVTEATGLREAMTAVALLTAAMVVLVPMTVPHRRSR